MMLQPDSARGACLGRAVVVAFYRYILKARRGLKDVKYMLHVTLHRQLASSCDRAQRLRTVA